MKRIYLDYAATTPVDPAVFSAMKPYFSEKFGNAGSLHLFGQEAIAAVDRSREYLARVLSAEFREIIFMGSASEANNLALRGIFRAVHKDPYLFSDGRRPRLIVSVVEHESILETARDLERDGVDVVYLPVDRRGVINLKDLKDSLTEDTVLVSVMYVNNEIGTVQPIAEVARIIREFRVESKIKNQKSSDKKRHYPFFHCDASQAFRFFDCNVDALGVDLMTLSSHKIYGPKGAAALYIRSHGATPDSQLAMPLPLPLMTGGGQEFGLRSGTENVPAIVGFTKAIELAVKDRKKEQQHTAMVKLYFWNGIKKIFPKAKVNGVIQGNRQSTKGRGAENAPHILNVYFPGHDVQDILTRFDLAGVAASSGSACRSRAMESSYVIEALGHSKERARSSIRFSFGRPTTKKEIDDTLKVLRKILR